MMGLPSLHTLDRAQAGCIWLAAEATDMRCGFDRLAERVRAVIGQDPLSGHLFVFRSRRGHRIKILLWEQDGFVLWYKESKDGGSEVELRLASAMDTTLRYQTSRKRDLYRGHPRFAGPGRSTAAHIRIRRPSGRESITALGVILRNKATKWLDCNSSLVMASA